MKNNKFQFSNLISKEDYNNFSDKEKENFLIKNKIYIKLDLNFSEKELKNKIELFGSKFRDLHYINEDVYEEIIEAYLLEKSIHWEIDDIIEQINLELENSLDIKNQKKYLKKSFKKVSKKINKIDLKTNYYSSKKRESNQQLGGVDFKFIVKQYISEDLVLNYLFISNTFYNDEDVFKQWTKLAKYDKILAFIKKKLNRLSNTSKLESTKTIIETDYNFKIFKSLKGETVFFEILRAFKAIDLNENAIDIIFKPVCFSIRESEYSKLIFKKGLAKSSYLKYLKEKFNSDIDVTKSKYSTSNKYNSDVDNLLSKL